MKHKKMMKLVSAILTLCILSVSLVGCNNSEDTAGKSSESKYTHRVIFVSDMHYTTEETAEELAVLYPDSNASGAAGKTYGYTQKEKIQAILDDIDAFSERESIDAVLVLGDLTLDDYGFRNLPENYLKKFKSDFVDKLEYPCYVTAGNHDSYPNEEFKAAMGTDRQYSVKIGDAVFVMLDTFSDEIATGGSGSPYVSVDVDFLEEQLEKYPTEKIFLCSHYYKPSATDYRFTKLLRENDRIICMFRGHTHNNTVLAPEELAYKVLVDIGAYAYDGNDTTGSWDFTQFDDDWAWGYQVLEWNDTEAHLYHVKTARQYNASNGVFDYTGAIEDDFTIQIKKDDN